MELINSYENARLNLELLPHEKRLQRWNAVQAIIQAKSKRSDKRDGPIPSLPTPGPPAKICHPTPDS